MGRVRQGSSNTWVVPCGAVRLLQFVRSPLLHFLYQSRLDPLVLNNVHDTHGSRCATVCPRVHLVPKVEHDVALPRPTHLSQPVPGVLHALSKPIWPVTAQSYDPQAPQLAANWHGANGATSPLHFHMLGTCKWVKTNPVLGARPKPLQTKGSRPVTVQLQGCRDGISSFDRLRNARHINILVNLKQHVCTVISDYANNWATQHKCF
mmetsp:Transcript_50007/g.140175  ORF Transcript_50007/g.140175 Transcript_50007/m.140175 type:complete len:207 (+) Transcript_50007:1001-1621(+)